MTAQLYRRGALLAPAGDVEHDRTARDHPAIASWQSSSKLRLLGAWHCSDAVTRGRAIAFTRQTSGRWQGAGPVACSLPVSTRVVARRLVAKAQPSRSCPPGRIAIVRTGRVGDALVAD